MICAHCQYVMDPFDAQCPRCGKAVGTKPATAQRTTTGQPAAPPNAWTETMAQTPQTAKTTVQSTPGAPRASQADKTPELQPHQIRIAGVVLLLFGVALTYVCWDQALKTGRFISGVAIAGPMLTVVGFGCAIFAMPFPQKGEDMEPITRVFMVLGVLAGLGNYVFMKGGL